MNGIVQIPSGIYKQDADGQGWTLLPDTKGLSLRHITNEEIEMAAGGAKARRSSKKYKLKKARPKGTLYRFEPFANIAEPPIDNSVPIKGSVMIYTDYGICFGRMYPVKEEATK